MSSIVPTAATSTASTTTSAGGSSAAGSATKSSLGKDQFLQLMMAQLKNQNPLSASNSDPMQYVTELAQFTSLEQQTNTAQSTAKSLTAQQTASAVGLIGKSVSYLDVNGVAATGTVQSVQIASAGPTLTVNGTGGIDPSNVTQVS
jgi:flagellar basal-body rod modification protein FlgD